MAKKKLNRKELKEKQEKTLAKMKKNREVDSNCLRDLLLKKIEWVKLQKAEGIKTIKQHQKYIEEIKRKLLRLEGVEWFLEGLFKEKEEK